MLPDSSSATPLSALPSVPTYGESLLDVDCEGGYNGAAASGQAFCEILGQSSGRLLFPSTLDTTTTDIVSPVLAPNNISPNTASSAITAQRKANTSSVPHFPLTATSQSGSTSKTTQQQAEGTRVNLASNPMMPTSSSINPPPQSSSTMPSPPQYYCHSSNIQPSALGKKAYFEL